MFRLPHLRARALVSLGCLVAGAVVAGGPPAHADVVRSGADITITIGTGIDTCALHADSDCFTTDQGWYVDVYDVAATLNQQDCVNLPGGYGT